MDNHRGVIAGRNRNGTLQFPSDTSLRLRYASIAEYPELIPVLKSARAAVVEAFDIDESRQADLVLVLEQVAVEAMVAAYAPLVLAAAQLSHDTECSRSAQAARVAQVARSMAAWTTEIAARLRERDRACDARGAGHVSSAADQAAPSPPAGIGAAKAAEVAAAVHNEARVKAAERAVAAQLVAERAASAALKVASDASAAAALVERQAFNAATTVHAIGLNMCYEVAIDAAANAAHQALAPNA